MNFAGAMVFFVIIAMAIKGWSYYNTTPTPIWSGYTAPGWEKVREVYKENVESGRDLGSAFAVYHQGELVVNLVGGYADMRAERPWTNNTVSLSFSVTKGITGVVTALLVDRGDLKYTDKVCKYWPEFAQNGKENVTVEMLLSHQAGLVLLDEKFESSEILSNPERMSQILAKQKPVWSPGTKHGYHIITYGLFVNELVKRADPEGRPLWVIFDEDIAKEFDIDFSIGLDYSDFYRSARNVRCFLSSHCESHSWNDLINALRFLVQPERRNLFTTALENPTDLLRGAGTLSPERANVPLGSSTGFGTAESIAKLYGILAAGNKYSGKRILSRQMVELLTEPVVSGLDVVTDKNVMYGRGTSSYRTNLGTTIVGYAGVAGQIGFADLEHELGFGYLTNHLCVNTLQDLSEPRYLRLQKAMYECAFKVEQKQLAKSA